MPTARVIRKGLIWYSAALFFGAVGIAIDRLCLGRSAFRTESEDLVFDNGSTQLTITTLSRRDEVIAVPLYCISLRDRASGKELPLVTLEDTFQEPGNAPRLVAHDDDNATFSVGKGTVEIRVPKVSIEGPSKESVYLGTPRE